MEQLSSEDMTMSKCTQSADWLVFTKFMYILLQ